MLIQVKYPNSRYDYVKDFMLDTMIEKEQIASFRRSSGWIYLGVDPVRSQNSSSSYTGEERRHYLQIES